MVKIVYTNSYSAKKAKIPKININIKINSEFRMHKPLYFANEHIGILH